MIEALTFDDVLLVPQYSAITPAEVSLKTRLTKNTTLDIPIVSAAMDTVTESEMAIALAKLGGIGIIHRNLSIKEQVLEVSKVKRFGLKVGAAVGPTENFIERCESLALVGVDVISIDCAHGYSQAVITAVKEIKKHLPKKDLIAGNVATYDGADALMQAGADAIKVGLGGGSICSSRIVAGVGVPQLTAITECARALNGYIPLIADGGIRFSGDITKALAAGANCVMLGGLLASTDEAPGDTITVDGKIYKYYRGMGSEAAMRAGSADRYGQTTNGKLVPEGVEARVPCRGPLSDLVYSLLGGLRSGMGYIGAGDIDDLHEFANFVRISSAGWRESNIHDVSM